MSRPLRLSSVFVATPLILLLVGCGSSHSTGAGALSCGAGTVQQGTTCIVGDGGAADAGSGLSCGPGTHQEGDQCLPDAADAGLDGGSDAGSDGGSDGGGWELLAYPGPYTGATPPDLHAVATSSGSDVWVGGSQALLHFDGAWHDACSQPGAACANILSLSDLNGEVWALNGGDVLHGSGGTWESLGTAVPSSQSSVYLPDAGCSAEWSSGTPKALAAVAADDLFVLASYEWSCDYGGGLVDQGPTGWMIRWNGSNWVAGGLPTMSRSGSSPSGLLAVSATDAWAVGTEADHFDGSTWSPVTATASARAIWKSGDADVWIVGDNALIEHWDGHTWSAISAPGAMINNLNGIWGSSPNDVWAVGGGGAIIHYDGTSWTRVPSPTTKTLRAIWGSGADEIWAVGDSGTVVHLHR